jgi:glycosyltransferase involved in cell wall biosynthesis
MTNSNGINQRQEDASENVMSNTLALSIISPAYNEAESLPHLVEDITKMLVGSGILGEIIIVDDGSTDGTDEVCELIASQYLNVRVFHHNQNLGKTLAMSTGIQNAQGKYVCLFESDGQYDPQDIPQILEPLKLGQDIVNGWRKIRCDPRYRIILSGAYNRLLRLFFKTGIRDHNSGLKAFSREAALRIFSPKLIKALGINPRAYHRLALVIAKELKYAVTEMPVKHYPRHAGRSYIHPLKTPWETFKAILKLLYVSRFRKSLFTDFAE